jgi:OOP family OmpA-OmpF porin
LLFLGEIDPTRVTAEGAGYLAPRQTNQTEAGRQQNRRVEAVPLTSTP